MYPPMSSAEKAGASRRKRKVDEVAADAIVVKLDHAASLLFDNQQLADIVLVTRGCAKQKRWLLSELLRPARFFDSLLSERWNGSAAPGAPGRPAEVHIDLKELCGDEEAFDAFLRLLYAGRPDDAFHDVTTALRLLRVFRAFAWEDGEQAAVEYLRGAVQQTDAPAVRAAGEELSLPELQRIAEEAEATIGPLIAGDVLKSVLQSACSNRADQQQLDEIAADLRFRAARPLPGESPEAALSEVRAAVSHASDNCGMSHAPVTSFLLRMHIEFSAPDTILALVKKNVQVHVSDRCPVCYGCRPRYRINPELVAVAIEHLIFKTSTDFTALKASAEIPVCPHAYGAAAAPHRSSFILRDAADSAFARALEEAVQRSAGEGPARRLEAAQTVLKRAAALGLGPATLAAARRLQGSPAFAAGAAPAAPGPSATAARHST
eukprot:tig00021434_g21308.t1